MAAQMPLDQVFIVSIWMEAVLYGFLLALTLASVYINLALHRHQSTHSRIMFGVGVVMWAIATVHLSLNCYRLIQGYVIHRDYPGGPSAWFSVLSSWDHVTKDTLYATQEILGDAIAIYRAWILWNQDCRILFPLVVLLIGGTISGYTVCGTFTEEHGTSNIFDHKLKSWISAFYAISFVQSVLTTGLMAYRIWSTERFSAKYRLDNRSLLPYLRILIESAALQLIAELIVLALYASGRNAQYILLEALTPVVGITFNAITIRIALRSSETFMNMKGEPRQHTSGYTTRPMRQTIGGSAMPAQAITINIDQDIETDARSDAEELDRK
ncbi:uncharacterized protein PHACADRAFT_261647 [Phanerochaete carnosa HHB-10118-sp]|uniref:Uncharacterized protein n=1 Tax=Phanerochaete carnosa (strain HHB-10118-sp) TaxID=650164 RepID=K5UP01_PHACS|nr:uncharacterized protein PHACADRAFT_261647 [Phanerochaete carnosa HHB-10118-sp]EKM51486.1 hypothetical protein PHACADRAFT_261647 [Phanerochaete carnosa HHB-10118-sp]